MPEAGEFITFEQPLTERVRTFLRLEFLFAQHRHHRQDASEFGIRATLNTLLDTLVVLSRSDLKNDILKELSDQHAHLTRLAARPGIDQQRLDSILSEITRTQNGLQQLATQFAGSLLRESDFLTGILNRSGIPGGTCGFDLAHYHYWLSQPRERVHRDLDAWHADVQPFEDAINLNLRMLRASVEAQPAIARSGMYVITPPGPCQLIRVLVPYDAGVYPEISAGKHRCTVRFMDARDANARAHQAMHDIAFRIQFCAL
ncbi:cell division protein ZapD [Sinimarinibacterium sp. CAU 1509]|uniref:cell division protein ZapD n=1 Tax=Sinimarinibacterium sp. CAU 1509 TaxID=2562283 RepID=UPI0010AC5C56|nr:cell division protein ZapD [Sinimarinibacterium sp. CAU 1509]TJY65174.1 cell division protein ZapD [Sinimarinibacterium sp. CAU 1509]